MISGQIDELRELAGDGSMEWVSGPFRASVLRDAADTIWELRDDLQRANADNARLRSELESVGTAAYLYGRSDLKAENAKLRELVRDMFGGYKGAVEMLPSSYSRNVAKGVVMDIYDRMRELGIEVR